MIIPHTFLCSSLMGWLHNLCYSRLVCPLESGSKFLIALGGSVPKFICDGIGNFLNTKPLFHQPYVADTKECKRSLEESVCSPSHAPPFMHGVHSTINLDRDQPFINDIDASDSNHLKTEDLGYGLIHTLLNSMEESSDKPKNKLSIGPIFKDHSNDEDDRTLSKKEKEAARKRAAYALQKATDPAKFKEKNALKAASKQSAYALLKATDPAKLKEKIAANTARRREKRKSLLTQSQYSNTDEEDSSNGLVPSSSQSFISRSGDQESVCEGDIDSSSSFDPPSVRSGNTPRSRNCRNALDPSSPMTPSTSLRRNLTSLVIGTDFNTDGDDDEMILNTQTQSSQVDAEDSSTVFVRPSEPTRKSIRIRNRRIATPPSLDLDNSAVVSDMNSPPRVTLPDDPSTLKFAKKRITKRKRVSDGSRMSLERSPSSVPIEQSNTVNEEENNSSICGDNVSDPRAARFVQANMPNLPSLHKRITRVMPPEEKDFSQMRNAVPPLLNLGERKVCRHCKALTYDFNCCDNGKVRIPRIRSPPNYIRNLLIGKSRAAQHFRENIVKYNNSFAMGSLSYDREKPDERGRGAPFVKINGMLHHFLSGAGLPPGKSVPLFHQLYKYDVNEAIRYRMMNPITRDRIKPNIARNIQMILESENFLVKQYKTAVELLGDMLKCKKPIKNLIVVLRSPHEVNYQGVHHPGTLERPRQEVQSQLYTMEPDGGPPKHGLYIVHRQHGGSLKVLGYWNPMVDPVGYPLLFPYGNIGFKRGEYRLETDYVVGQDPFDDDQDRYPFESLNDEMEDGVEAIDYHSARINYKDYCRSIGEIVSESEEESECDEDFEEDPCDIAELMNEIVSDDDDARLGHQFLLDSSADESPPDPMDVSRRIVINTPPVQDSVSDLQVPESQELEAASTQTHRSAVSLVDDNYLPDIDAPVSSNSLLSEATESNDFTDDIRHLNDRNDSINIQEHYEQDGIDDIADNDKRREEVNKRDAYILQRMYLSDRRRKLREDKIRAFKAILLQSRAKTGLLDRLFKDFIEVCRVNKDLDFIEWKSIKHRDTLYHYAEVLLNMNRSRVDLCYPYDLDLKHLQADIDYEIECIMSCVEYRSEEKKIQDFRTFYLASPNLDDNMDKEADEEPDDEIQREVGNEFFRQKEEKKKHQPVRCGKGKRVFVSRSQFALHQMQIRDPEFHPYLSTLLLGQLYVIDLALRIIRQRNDNTRDHLIKLRGSHENTLTYQMHAKSAVKKGFQLGYAFQISNTKPGSSAWYKQQFENAMAVMDHTGKPDLFITFTGDPHWEEISSNLLPHSEWQSNPFLVNDVFHLKMQELLDDVIHKELFGPVVSYCYSIEFQKRGMPHMHLLITLQDGHKLDTSDKIDSHIKSHIPPEPEDNDPERDLKLRYRENVIKHMLHTACIDNDDAYCKKGSRPGSSRCTKYFPYPFNTHTQTVDGGKVQYHRPDDSTMTCEKPVTSTKSIKVDNRYVVPHSPFLLNKYGCHVNVEAVTTVDVVKYIYKYIYKGFDRALAQLIESSEVDDGLSGSAPRTAVHASKYGRTGVLAPRGVKGTQKQWTDVNNRIAQEFRKVINLSIHIEGQMPVFYRAGEEEAAIQKVAAGKCNSPLVAWFELNKRDPNARKYTYNEIPLHYNFNQTTREWRPYLRTMNRNIVRVRPVSVRFLDQFAVRLLAMHQRGPQSFQDLCTVDGHVFEKPNEAARKLGLMDSQVEFECCLEEATTYTLPNKLRRMFATILIFGGVKDPAHLWDTFKPHFLDRRLASDPERAVASALFHIDYMLKEHGQTVSDFGFGSTTSFDHLSDIDRDLAIDDAIMNTPNDPSAEATRLVNSLNNEQKAAFTTVLKAVHDGGQSGSCFFLQGSGGCGKTYVYRALYHRLKSEDISVTMIATTGIAATLLINGTTAHRKFMLPLNIEEGTRSTMKAETQAAKDIRETTVFIIDESTMASRFAFQAIDQLLRDLTGNKNLPFGGKIMLLGGDWKQLLPVVPGGSSDDAVRHTLKADDLWSHFKVLTLTQNMRAHNDPAYATLLENIGNGFVNGVANVNARIDPNCILQTPDDVIDFLYGDMSQEPEELSQSCILTSLNIETLEVNKKVLDRLPGRVVRYKALDTPRDGIGMQIPPEYFRNVMPSGMPPHDLDLKIGAIVILLRNINVSKGLCNGSRLKVVKLHAHFIVCVLLTTNFAGSVVWLGKITTDPPAKGKKNSNFSRLQIPVRLAYAMTINKSQGQTFDRVGLILKNNVFAHGQLYVALSRARESKKVRIYSSSRSTIDDRTVVSIKNKVERSVLEVLPEGYLIDPNYLVPEYLDAIEEESPYVRPRGKLHVHDHSQPSTQSDLIKKNRRTAKCKL